jgi:hypothetical protein
MNKVCSLSQMPLALLHVNMSSATGFLSVNAEMLAALASSCRHPVVPFPAAAVHLQAVQGTSEIHQLCPLGNGHPKALKSAISM